MSKNYVTASELGDYVYCKRSWWLKVQGLSKTTGRMQEGTAGHEDLFNSINSYSFKKILALVLITFGLILFMVAVFLTF